MKNVRKNWETAHIRNECSKKKDKKRMFDYNEDKWMKTQSPSSYILLYWLMLNFILFFLYDFKNQTIVIL